MGLPVLAFANEPHEEKTIAFFAEQGMCRNLGSVHVSSQDVLRNRIAQYLRDIILLEKLSAACCSYFRENGLAKCVKAIQEVLRWQT